MSRSAPQLNIRSAFARDRATMLARRTGLTTTQVVEEALRAWNPADAVPTTKDAALPPGLIRKGRLLVLAAEGRPAVTTEALLQAIDDAREERADMAANPDAH